MKLLDLYQMMNNNNFTPNHLIFMNILTNQHNCSLERAEQIANICYKVHKESSTYTLDEIAEYILDEVRVVNSKGKYIYDDVKLFKEKEKFINEMILKFD